MVCLEQALDEEGLLIPEIGGMLCDLCGVALSESLIDDPDSATSIRETVLAVSGLSERELMLAVYRAIIERQRLNILVPSRVKELAQLTQQTTENTIRDLEDSLQHSIEDYFRVYRGATSVRRINSASILRRPKRPR